jgi:hypothetical protein
VFQATKHQFINQSNHDLVKQELIDNNISFKELVGSYQGEVELSYIVPNNAGNLAFVNSLARQYNQQCIMTLDNHKHGTYKAYFVNCTTGESIFQGYLRSIPKATIDALKLDYSFVREDMNKHFTIWPTDTTQESLFLKEVKQYKQGGLCA